MRNYFYLLAILMSLSLVLMGCVKEETTSSGPLKKCEEVSGFYLVTSGTQQISDNQGTDKVNDIEGAYADVDQGGCAVEFFGCLGIMQDGSMECDSRKFGIDSMFGTYLQETEGRLDFSGGELTGSMIFRVKYPMAGYEGESEIHFTSVKDVELTRETQPLTKKAIKRSLIPVLE